MICDTSVDFDLFTATPFEMFENIHALGESIHNDIKLLENDALPSIFDEDIISEMPFLQSEKIEIRQHDCMWSGRCKTDIEKNKVTAAKVSQHSFHHHHSHTCTDEQMLSTSPIQTQKIVAPHDVTNNIFVPQDRLPAKQNIVSSKVPTVVKSSATAAISKDLKTTTTSTMQNIAPGTSLLINSRFNQQKKHSHNNSSSLTDSITSQQNNNSNKSSNNSSSSIPVISTSDFLRQREQPQSTTPNFFQIRPESPLSLDDDPPETKHSVDLSACMVGSNNISLESSFNLKNSSSHQDFEKSLRIKTLCEQLEDPTVVKISTEKMSSIGNVEDIDLCLDVMKNHAHEMDDDLLDEDKSDVDSDSSDTYHTKSHSPSSGYGSQSPEYNNPHSDHSYTRSKNGGLSGLGVETPSDSDEEIDVVSVGDKKLPTNPSDKDRRVLQTKVANRFTSRMVTTSNGLRTIPPKRSKDSSSSNSSIVGGTRHVYSSSNTSTSSNSPATHPYAGLKKPIYNPMASVNGHHHHHHHLTAGSQSRKRHSLATSSSSSYKDDYSPSSKRSRGKKSRPSSGSNRRHNNNSNNNSSINNNTTNSNNGFDQDEAETIEKRNLHNNMERQRRIGLKNLFESLKRQIPNIKDKDRAPKVNILREAAKLCEQLTRDENQHKSVEQQLQIQLQRKQSQLRMLKQQLQQRQQQQQQLL